MSIARESLERFASNTVFVETGTHTGRCIALAVELFERVVSIEIDRELHEQAKARFKDDRKVTLLNGDSAELLAEALPDMRATVYLDAHGKGEKGQPLFAELGVLKEHKVKTHTVIIDDWNDYAKHRAKIEEILLGVNEKYEFRVIDGWRDNNSSVVKNGLFVAEVAA